MDQRDRKTNRAYTEAQRRIAACHTERSRRLDLCGLRLTALPPEIGDLTALTGLNLSANQLTVLPPEVGQLTALMDLNLHENQLIVLPPEIGQLTALTTLYVGRNELTALPPEIGQLTALEKLSLFQNRLVSLPPEVGQLTALTWLNLFDNQLTALPREIGRLSALTSLNVLNNQLTTLPTEIRQLTALKELYLHGNPGLGVPNEVLGPSRDDVVLQKATPKPPHEILAAYFRIAGGQGESLGECKLVVVGRGGVGKTSLVKRLQGQSYDPHERETHGVAIQNLKFHGRQGDVTARVWDFGGQVVLHSMHEFFLTARSLYLLVLGERDDMLERDAAYWLQLIRSYAGDAPVVVALNKSARRQRPFDAQTFQQQYGSLLGFVATECSEADPDQGGITKLRGMLTASLDGPLMDSIRRKFPKKWRSIKDELEQMPDSYLDYDEYVRLCEKYEENVPAEQAALAGDLHDLGVALNYARDPRLRDTTVLRPDWLANGIYAVLRANDGDQRLPPEFDRPLAPDGVVDEEMLKQIHRKAEAWGMLRASDYPSDKRAFLLRLMGLFHLSYPLDDEGRQQLVPTLLPLTPPAETDEPTDADRTRLRYEFQVVPAPLMPWFIARTFSLIPNRLHWRRGAILAYGEARARVWTTQDERYVFVTAAGPKQNRKRLLAMIRGTLCGIFREYKALHPVEQWEHKGSWVPRATLEEFDVLPRELQRDFVELDGDEGDEEVSA